MVYQPHFCGTRFFKAIVAFAFVLSAVMLSGNYKASAQQGSVWATLGMVTFKKSFDQATMVETMIPSLSPLIEKLDGTEIEVEGYIIPLTGQIRQSHFMLSKFPQSTCFFCGKAGPETAMQVFMRDQQKVRITERKVKVKGTLLVRPGDASSLMYTLENALLFEQ
jgi:hypothetical protein